LEIGSCLASRQEETKKMKKDPLQIDFSTSVEISRILNSRFSADLVSKFYSFCYWMETD
jgi:hypothetical protein